MVRSRFGIEPPFRVYRRVFASESCPFDETVIVAGDSLFVRTNLAALPREGCLSLWAIGADVRSDLMVTEGDSMDSCGELIGRVLSGTPMTLSVCHDSRELVRYLATPMPEQPCEANSEDDSDLRNYVMRDGRKHPTPELLQRIAKRLETSHSPSREQLAEDYFEGLEPRRLPDRNKASAS